MSSSGKISTAITTMADAVTRFTSDNVPPEFHEFARISSGFRSEADYVFTSERNDHDPRLEQYYSILGQLVMQAILKAAMDMRHFSDTQATAATVEERIARARAARHSHGFSPTCDNSCPGRTNPFDENGLVK